MKRALVLLLLATLAHADDRRGRFERFCTRTEQGRTRRGFDCSSSFAFFEAFPASGAGAGSACAGTTPSAATGGSMTHTRASNGTCTTLGYATSGIPVGGMTVLGANVPRVEFNSAGVLALLVESTATQDALRTEELDNAFWTSTATVAANAAVPPNNTNQTSNAEQLSDVSGAALQGSCQTIASTSATQHTAFVHVRAGTASSAQITMTGAGSSAGDCTATVTGLSGATWNVLSCTSPAAYAGTLTSLTLCVNVGDTAAATGTIMAWGYNHYAAAPYRTSYMPAVAASVARNSDLASFAFTQTAPTTGSFAVTVQLFGATINNAGLLSQENGTTFLQSLISIPGSQTNVYNGGVSKASAVTGSAGLFRAVGWFDGASTNLIWNGVTTSGTAGAAGSVNTLRIGNYSNSFVQDGLYSQACGDPLSTRCR